MKKHLGRQVAAGFLIFFATSLGAQQVRVMQWNIHGTLGVIASNSTAGAQAIARIVNYNQPDVLLFNEVESQTVAANQAALINWVTNNVPYLGTQAGTSFFVAVSTITDGYNRNGAISRYPILGETTYDDGLRGLHAFKIKLNGTNVLQIFHAHLKCCSDNCPEKQTEAQFDANTISAWAAANAAPYVFGGDWNEDEENPECTLSTTYHPITTIRQDGGFAEFKPRNLDGEYRTWSTAATTPSIRFDYIYAATNRLSPTSGFVFSTMNWASHGLYTNASPQNLANDSKTASDHYCVFADYSFSASGPTLTVLPTNNLASTGNQGGPFSPAGQTYTLSNSGSATLSWTATNTANWLTLSATAGTLAAGVGTNVTASINANANDLAAGGYSDTVSFTNLTNRAGNTTRAVSLTVSSTAAQLTVSPMSGLTASGPVGGPFSPGSKIYTLSNVGSATLGWTAANTANWLTLSAAGGTLPVGASTNVNVSVNANANGLAAGGYSYTVSFTNTTNGAGNTMRAVNLTVSSFGFFDDFSTFADGNLVGQSNWTQVSTISTLPLQVAGGRVVIPFGQSANNQDAYKNFRATNGTVFYGMTLVVSNAPNNTSPSYFSAMTISNNGAGYANYRLTAKDNGGGTCVLGARITGETGDPYTFGTSTLTYGTQYRVIIEADSGGLVTKVFVNPTNDVLGTQTPYVTNNIGSGTAPTQVGSFVISQFGSGTVPNDGVSIGKVVVADNFAAVYNFLTGTVPPPVASFTGSPTSGTEPLTVAFGDTSSGGITNRFWDFGDGVTTNTTATSVTHAYAAGAFDVTLVVSGPGGVSTNTQPDYITALTAFQSWQIQYFGSTTNPAAAASADPDGDGQENMTEFLAGTNPTNSASAFRLTTIALEGNDIRVTWMMGSGKTNVLQRAEGGTGGSITNNFTDLYTVVTIGSVTNYLDAGAATNTAARYYRVRLAP